ncbi:MAG: YjjI family glycine radical enzyme [Oligoflexia bacterium]|nr:YjjI family glycine radical enzyme [Oligoflexia bacterium]
MSTTHNIHDASNSDEETRKIIRNVICDDKLEYHHKRSQLCTVAENILLPISTNDEVICTLFEGNAPYRPRYILPDYQKFLATGSEYLNLPPADDIVSAINHLLIIYKFVPSITSHPVYLGNVDTLLDQYDSVEKISELELRRNLRWFLIQIDRTLPNAFVHMNLGPLPTRVGRVILELERELRHAVPNLTLKVDFEITNEDFLLEAIKTALVTNKPYFANHQMLKKIYKSDAYGVASCYNTLPIGGGAHTLVRINLKLLAQRACDLSDFMNNLLPSTVTALAEIISARIRFLVEESHFFQTSFLIREKLIELEKFTAMAGIFGLYEATEILSAGKILGKDQEALLLAEAILVKINKLLRTAVPLTPYCAITDGVLGLHAQSGIDNDKEVTPGVRIKSGAELSLGAQIRTACKLHSHFVTGVSDIYTFEPTAANNLPAMLTIITGALRCGMAIMSIGSSDSPLVRISGYLVKKSDLEKADKSSLREESVELGARFIDNYPVSKRKKWSER